MCLSRTITACLYSQIESQEWPDADNGETSWIVLWEPTMTLVKIYSRSYSLEKDKHHFLFQKKIGLKNLILLSKKIGEKLLL